MALSTPSNLAGVTDNNNTTTVVTGTIGPSSGSLLIISTGYVSGVNTTLSSVTTTLSNVGTWTIVQATNNWQASPARYTTGAIAYAMVTGAPGTGTITATFGSATRGKVLRVAEVTGHNTTTPVAQSKTNTGTSDTLTVTLDSTPNSANMVFAAVIDVGAGTITPGNGFTEIGETTLDSTLDTTIETEYDYQSADTTADWTTLGAVGNVGVAIEINEDGGGGTVVKDIIGNGIIAFPR